MGKIKTLLLTGQHNHDWKRSSAFCRDLLVDSGRFDVTLVENTPQKLADAEAIGGCELFFLDYNGPAEPFSPVARANFEQAVRSGAGVVFLHGSNNGFAGWTEMEKIAALMWREGTGHGQFHEFAVRIVDHDHPITVGIDDFRTWDELYHRLVPMHGVPFEVLAAAFSDPATNGSGRDEPMMVVSTYGNGRVFQQVLGHVWKGEYDGTNKGVTMISFENPGFQRTLLRGCQWAATGEVTIR